MTIAVSLKVNDGLVLAADSATTLVGQGPQPDDEPQVFNVYNNANKIFNLRKGLPIGAITFGAGSIGRASISTLVKDLRRRFTGDDQSHLDWTIAPASYSIADVAERFRQFMFEEHYRENFSPPNEPALGFVVAGYSSDGVYGEEYSVQTPAAGGVCEEIKPVREGDECGISWSGQPEAISRLVEGVSPGMLRVLKENLGVPDEQVSTILDVMKGQLTVTDMTQPAMPIQDAVDLAEFLVNVTINYVRFCNGAPTVGGPIEVAAITKHEGFKWVRRKYYYTEALNP